jgi:choline dehydrogenase-like flavoprotein
MAATALQADLLELEAASAVRPFDSVVIGGGSSGLTTARTLLEAGLKVAVLEQGPAPFLTNLTNTELRYGRKLLRSLRESVSYRQALVGSAAGFGPNYGCLGGRGLFWNGASPRYAPHDFAGWPEDAIPSHEDYSWAEARFRVTQSLGRTPLADKMIAGLRAAGFDAGPSACAVDVDDLWVGRLSAGLASGLGLFLRACGDALVDGRMRMAIDSQVQSLIMDGDRVRGLRVSPTRDPAAAVEILARSVVLCAGGIESIKIAAVSGIPDPHQRIGKGLQEHLFFEMNVHAPELYDPDRPDSALVYIRALAQDAHQWEVHAPGSRLFVLDDGTPWAPTATAPYEITARSFAATDKRDENFVEAKAGPVGSSMVHFSYTAADNALKARVAADALKLCAALNLVPTDGKSADAAERFRPPGASYHEAGGLDMGLDVRTSVTDPAGRFHSVPNLISSDAAAFTRIPATNPHLTLVAVARRKAQVLAADLKRGT